MWQNFLKVAWRNAIRNKLHTTINVLGLALGIGACMVIYQIVAFEYSFDQFRPERELIHRITTRFSGSFEATNSGVPGPVAQAVEDKLIGFQAVAPYFTFGNDVEISLAEGQKKEVNQKGSTVFADSRYFEVLRGEEWLAGTPADALNAPYQVVLTEANAQHIFGTSRIQDVLGKTLIYADSLPVTIMGIIRDRAGPSDFAFGAYISLSTIRNSWLEGSRFQVDSWSGVSSNSQVLVKLEEGFTEERFNEQLKKISAIYAEKNPEASWQIHLTLQPFEDIHYNSDLRPPASRHVAHRPTLLLLVIVALLLLIIAGVNFVNLETARAAERAKEVGVRKVLGGSRSSLRLQFLSETFFITAIAVMISFGLADWALRYFTEFIPEGMNTSLFKWTSLLFLGCVLLVVGLLAGIYPAFVLSAFQPVQTLKNQVVTSGKTSRKAYLRKSLIVFQFTVAQVLIISTLFIGRQIDYMLSKDLGFRQDAIVAFYHPFFGQDDHRELMKEELARIPGIQSQSLHQSLPAEDGYSRSLMEAPEIAGDLKLNVNRKYGDTAFIDLYGIQLVAGRNLMPSDTVREFLVNETLVRHFGLEDPQQIIDQQLLVNKKYYPVVGVVQDFHVQSLHNPLEPVAISNNNGHYCHSFKLTVGDQNSTDISKTIDQVAMVWKKLYPDDPFEYEFVDESIASFYESEQRTAKLMRTATIIAIFISCLGLFGLASFTAARRVKEIGIRKVLGASIANIVGLISRDFLKLVLVGILLATPMAWFAMHRWMEGFAFSAGLRWHVFVLAALAAILIAVFTVAYQSVQAAIANPVDSLRNE